MKRGVLLMLLAGIGCAQPTGPLSEGTHDLRIDVGGDERSYFLHLPPGIDADGNRAPLPLVLAFHGGGGRAAGFITYAGLNAVADREGFAIAYPDGSGGIGRRLLTWNAGLCCGGASRDGTDDVGFARALVDEIAQRVAIDRRRVYATGHSNGAMMSYRIAAEAPDLVAAIAPIAGAMMLEAFEAHTPVPVLHMHSVDDPRALYLGGLGPPFPFTGKRVVHNAVESELARWIALNGCAPEPIVSPTIREQTSGHTATHLRYTPCKSDADVELWRLTGAGHGWPGGDAALPERIVGTDTNVIVAAEEIWRFVSRFSKE